MTRPFFLFVVITSAILAADASESVLEAAHGWRQGAIRQDQAALLRFLADDLVYTHGGGKTQSKAEYIADVTKGTPHYESFNQRDARIRIYGKTAVLIGVVDVTPAKGEPYRVRTFEVYTEKNGNWQLAQKESVRISH